MSKVILRTPLLSASGKTFGMKSHYSLCTRKATGLVYTYHWPENYLYPIIPKRQQAAHRLGKASLLYNLVAANSTLLRQFQKDYEAHERKHRRKPLKVKHYTNLRYFIIAYYTDQMKNHQQSYDRLAASITGTPLKQYVSTPTNAEGKPNAAAAAHINVSEANQSNVAIATDLTRSVCDARSANLTLQSSLSNVSEANRIDAYQNSLVERCNFS